MVKLTSEQVTKKIEFINHYLHANNAADSSKVDANANVTLKNIATLEAEINKDINIQINRALISQKIENLYGKELAVEYLRQIKDHEIYVHDETSIKPYCVSVTMYPLLLDGMKKLGGESLAPKHLNSFCGTFVNFVFAISSQFAGAVATVEFLTYFDHFARKDFGDNYLLTHKNEVSAALQQVVYSINQPAAARGYQSVFWNISIYDQYYFEAMYSNFVFPDEDRPSWNSVDGLQRFFLSWFNQEREKALLTFPVVTVALLTENDKVRDRNYSALLSKELSQGNSFFMYLSDSPDSLASCCRLRNEIKDNTFSYSLGAGGVATGSINVITLNMNRLIQSGANLSEQIQKLHKYQIAYRKIIEEFKAAGVLTVYDAGFISLDKQYLTIGINGMVEAAEYLGITISNNSEYKNFVTSQLKIIYDLNKKAQAETGYMFNTEFVPAENLGVKNAQWDKKDNYQVNRDCYNSYFYIVEDENINFLDKFQLHGKEMIQFLDGGSALHLNLEEALTEKQYVLLIDYAAKTGCNYFCTNIKVTVCNDCEYIDKRTQQKCSKCGSKNIDYATRVIGYLKRITSFSKARRVEHNARQYHKHTTPKSAQIDQQAITL
ncbi:MAG: anaerobic ribonucleoside-triphosphate reductase [Pseudobdellovibrio sp.]